MSKYRLVINGTYYLAELSAEGKELYIKVDPRSTSLEYFTSVADLIIQEGRATRTLTCCLWDYSPEVFTSIMEALTNPRCNLTEIRLDTNKIGDRGAFLLAGALMTPGCKVTTVSLTDNEIGPSGMEKLIEAFSHPGCKVREINLSGNRAIDIFSCSDYKMFFNLLHSVVVMNLSCNGIGALGAMLIAKVLQTPECRVAKINLACNSIGDDGASALAETLKTASCNVTGIGVAATEISNLSAFKFAAALNSPSCKVTEMDLSSNHIDDRGMASLVLMLMVLVEDSNGRSMILNFAANPAITHMFRQPLADLREGMRALEPAALAARFRFCLCFEDSALARGFKLEVKDFI